MSELAAKLQAAIKRQDGIAVSRLISIVENDVASVANSTNEAMLENDISSQLTDPLWIEVAVCYWKVTSQILENNIIDAYSAQNSLLIAINRVAERNDNWILPVMQMVAKELRQISTFATLRADAESKKFHLEKQEEATRTINRSFNLCLNDRNPEIDYSKKWGAYFFAGELFKIYFKLNKYSLAKDVIKVRNAKLKELPSLEEYPRSHKVTFLYYWGVLLFIDENYESAEEKLSESFNQCLQSSTKNKEAILLYLIITRLIVNSQKAVVGREYLPSKELWEQYPRLKSAYYDIIKYCSQGDVKSFDRSLFIRRKLFINRYIYLAMEKIRNIAIYNLFYKLYSIEGKPTRLSVDLLRSGLKIVGYFDDNLPIATSDAGDGGEGASESERDINSYELDETECIIANFIRNGGIKGYISHERRMIVLSNKDPFPYQGK